MSTTQQTQDAHAEREREEIDPISEHIQTVADLHKSAERRVSPQQRAIEKVTNFLGRPRFLLIILAVVVLWIAVTFLLPAFGLRDFDPPPFSWLAGLLTLGALLQATMILITQNRQDTMVERRTQLDLQVSLLLDEKISKLITMVDQMRQVHPDLENGTDPQVEALKETVDPHQSLKTLEQMLEEDNKQV
ncbi:MAG TPA: DUF1003 domain-containing protein [Ktedonobacteraceae bacterium]